MQMSQINPPDDWLKTGWARVSQTRTRLVVSLFCITCSLKNNAFSVLYYVIKVTLHYQGAYSLRSKRFRLVLEQKRPWKGIFGFDRARNETRTKKWKRGEGRGRKDKVRKNGQQTRTSWTSCCRTSWIAMWRVLQPTVKPVNNLICSKTGLMWVVKRATSLFNWFCSNNK